MSEKQPGVQWVDYDVGRNLPIGRTVGLIDCPQSGWNLMGSVSAPPLTSFPLFHLGVSPEGVFLA